MNPLRKIRLSARSSLLSKAQVSEWEKKVAQKLALEGIELEKIWLETEGDKDKHTSLRVAPEDFFTRQIDLHLLEGKSDIALHSAKDLPANLHPELDVFALTEGVDPRDALIFHAWPLIRNAKVGVSSLRREEMVRSLRADLQIVEIRGTIQERLELMDRGIVDALVVAQAALLRLELYYIKRVWLPFFHPLQGKLALVGRKKDEDLQRIFSC